MVSADCSRSSHNASTKQGASVIRSGSLLNVAGSDGTGKGSHSELLDEELNETGCTPQTPQQVKKPYYALLLCGRHQRQF